MGTRNPLYNFMELLETFPAFDTSVFNPWKDVDPVNDWTEQAAAIRRFHLSHYLAERRGHAKVVLVAEAPGFNGCKFSGIPMCSERILLGNHSRVPGHHVTSATKRATSLSDAAPLGRNEATATVVWQLMAQAGFEPREFVLWNAFAFHPHRPESRLSNRAPTLAEVEKNLPVLTSFLGLFSDAKVIAVGNVAKRTMWRLGIACPGVRHPAMGGAALFRTQMQHVLASSN